MPTPLLVVTKLATKNDSRQIALDIQISDL
jgi:hypothetical protein